MLKTKLFIENFSYRMSYRSISVQLKVTTYFQKLGFCRSRRWKLLNHVVSDDSGT